LLEINVTDTVSTPNTTKPPTPPPPRPPTHRLIVKVDCTTSMGSRISNEKRPLSAQCASESFLLFLALYTQVWEAHDLAVGDRLTPLEKASGTTESSDPYCVVELLDRASQQPLKSSGSSLGNIGSGNSSGSHSRQFKTPIVKRSLAPVWQNAETTMAHLTEPVDQILVKVTVYDAALGQHNNRRNSISSGSSSMFSGQKSKEKILGGFIVPLSTFYRQESAGPRWFPLENVPEMARTTSSTVGDILLRYAKALYLYFFFNFKFCLRFSINNLFQGLGPPHYLGEWRFETRTHSRGRAIERKFCGAGRSVRCL